MRVRSEWDKGRGTRLASRGRARRRHGRAPIFSDEQVATVENWIAEHSNCPVADLLKFRLSVYAGLRAGEISKIQVPDLVEPEGEVSKFVNVPADVGKGRRARSIDMHSKVCEAVLAFLAAYPGENWIAFSQRWSKRRHQSPAALSSHLSIIYRNAGLEGFTSHSGRRTFITKLARATDGTNFTVRDVQYLAGHAVLQTTQVYIDRSARLHSLVEQLR